MFDLGQGKKRNKKVFITDIAIEKVPFIEYKGYSKEQNNVMRDKEYDYKKAFILFRECINGLNRKSSIKEQYLASLTFLAKSSEVGVYYR